MARSIEWMGGLGSEPESEKKVEKAEDFNLEEGDIIFFKTGSIRLVEEIVAKDGDLDKGFMAVVKMGHRDDTHEGQRYPFEDLLYSQNDQGSVAFIERSKDEGIFVKGNWMITVYRALTKIHEELGLMDAHRSRGIPASELRYAELLAGEKELETLLAKKAEMDAKEEKRKKSQ